MINIVSHIIGKPIVGLVGGYGSLVSAILTILGILTPIVGFFGCVFGTMAAYHSWRINKRNDKK